MDHRIAGKKSFCFLLKSSIAFPDKCGRWAEKYVAVSGRTFTSSLDRQSRFPSRNGPFHATQCKPWKPQRTGCPSRASYTTENFRIIVYIYHVYVFLRSFREAHLCAHVRYARAGTSAGDREKDFHLSSCPIPRCPRERSLNRHSLATLTRRLRSCHQPAELIRPRARPRRGEHS